MDTPCPFKPGDLYPIDAPRWGVARVGKRGGGSITLMDCSQADADAAARVLVAHAAVLAERDRYRLALERIAAAWPTVDPVSHNVDRQRVARHALYGSGQDAADDAQIAAALRDIEARGTTCEALEPFPLPDRGGAS